MQVGKSERKGPEALAELDGVEALGIYLQHNSLKHHFRPSQQHCDLEKSRFTTLSDHKYEGSLKLIRKQLQGVFLTSSTTNVTLGLFSW